MMTDDELTTIRARVDAAIGLGAKDYFEISCLGIEPNLSFCLESNVIATEKEIEADKAFIGNARRDVLTLLAEVERLRTENASLRESLDLSDLIIDSETVK